ncbi:phage head morphogenesis protein [Streptomyces olivaceus]|uniref:phage head morphogenesis protein n=1 Tax=Streptomyces olivaceus TaxID=47716 RepID=UPI001CCBAC67|nr:phage head morphogenesis protein [Streptomyces olivaceus]MBZ6253620.1 phage head morphogenesis protein [Streptomyces olivaceus]
MAKFTPAPGLEEALARMLAPDVRRIAMQVEVQAKRLAPPTKRWVTVGDDRVRPTHVHAQGQMVPGNLRFAINSMEWDRKHRGVGSKTYMLEPRDESSRAVANLKNCRCTTHKDPDGIAKHINTGQPVVAGKKVTVTVSVQAPLVVEAEVGTVYPGNLVADGAHFMSRAAAIVAARR